MRILAFVAVAPLVGCAVEPDESLETENATTQYVSIFDFAKTDQGAFYDLVQKMNGEFVKTGGFPNVTPLSFFCSVTSKLGSVHDCVYTFASSQVAVDGTTAQIGVNAATYQCHIRPKMSSVKMIATLSDADDAIHTPLTGTGSIADTFADCFANPIGATPITTAPGTTYVEAASYYATPANQKKWFDTTAALKLGFDNVCGDTFCGSDFGDLQSLTFACAVTKSTGNVKSCAWTFGGSFLSSIAPNGSVAIESKNFTCPITMHGTIAQLISTVTGPGTEDAIHRPLPGVTTTAYDEILCLP